LLFIFRSPCCSDTSFFSVVLGVRVFFFFGFFGFVFCFLFFFFFFFVVSCLYTPVHRLLSPTLFAHILNLNISSPLLFPPRHDRRACFRPFSPVLVQLLLFPFFCPFFSPGVLFGFFFFGLCFFVFFSWFPESFLVTVVFFVVLHITARRTRLRASFILTPSSLGVSCVTWFVLNPGFSRFLFSGSTILQNQSFGFSVRAIFPLSRRDRASVLVHWEIEGSSVVGDGFKRGHFFVRTFVHIGRPLLRTVY